MKKPMLENTPPKAEDDLAAKKNEVTEAMKKDMEKRAQQARTEIEALCKRLRVEIISQPGLAPLPGGVFGVVGQTVIKPLE